LNARLELRALDLKAGDIASGRDVANGLASANDEDHHDGQNDRAVEAQFEGLDPNEGANWSSVDARIVKVSTGCGDNAASQETKNDAGGLHDRGSKAFAEQDGHENQETQSNVLCTSPRKSVRSTHLRTNLKWPTVRPGGAQTRTASPVLEA
jgi:hypothetical protein